MIKGSIQKGELILHDAIWFSSELETIGIVLVYNKTSEKLKSYIGRGKGYSACDDAVRIMENGAPFPIDSATVLFENSIRNVLEIKECEMYECLVQLLSDGKELYNHPSKENDEMNKTKT